MAAVENIEDEITLAELQAQLRALQAEVAQLRNPSATTHAADGPTLSEHAEPVSRRAALRTAGVVAAGAIAGGAALLQSAAPAAAYTSSGTFNATSDSVDYGVRAIASSTRKAIYATSAHDGIHAIEASTSGGNYAYGVWGIADTNNTNSGVRGTAAYGNGVKGDSTSGTGVSGTSDSGAAGRFVSTSGTGVDGQSSTSYGVSGFSNSGAGVIASSNYYYGLVSSSNTSTAVLSQGVVGVSAVGYSSGGLGGSGLVCEGDRATMYLVPSGSAPPVRTTQLYNMGEVHVDGSGGLWYCVTSGTSSAATWRQLSGPTTSGSFTAIAPVRVYDSRKSAYTQHGPIANGGNRTVSVADSHDPSNGSILATNVIPDGATAISANVTVVNTVATNNFCINPGGDTTRPASMINWFDSGQTLANGVSIKISASREVTIVAGGQGGSADIIIDVLGYWR